MRTQPSLQIYTQLVVDEGRKHIFPSGVATGKVRMLLYTNPPHVLVNNTNKTHWVTYKALKAGEVLWKRTGLSNVRDKRR